MIWNEPAPPASKMKGERFDIPHSGPEDTNRSYSGRQVHLLFENPRPPKIPVLNYMDSHSFTIEILTAEDLAVRLKVKTSWVIDHSSRAKTSDPIPVFRLGEHRRYRWGSPEMNAWLDRRAGVSRKAGQ
jgi:hypothetical protein